jgi:hypothetical protein
MGETCATCRFFRITTKTVGLLAPHIEAFALCRRYPREEPVSINYWCGEHKPKDGADHG